MDSLERCRILCGISEDNTKKLGLLSVLLEKAREDIEAFCRDTFIEALTNDEGIITGYVDVFPKQLNPYVLSLVVVSVWNTLNDPTTKGLGDSARAKSYTAPQ